MAELKHQYPQQNSEDEDNQKDGERDEEQNLRDSPRALGDSGETEETGNERNDEKDNSPFDHEGFLGRAELSDVPPVCRL
jgi:hypothetical protein